MKTCAFFYILHNTVHISINNFISTYLSAKNNIDCRRNYIQQNQRNLRVYIGSIDENLNLFIPQFFVFDKTLTSSSQELLNQS